MIITGQLSPEIKKISFELTDVTDIIQEVTGVPPLNNWKAEFPPKHDALFDQWYKSFDREADPRTQSFDYSVYSHPDYMYITHDCFKGWSRGSTINTIKFFNYISHTPKSFMDVFGGVGQTAVLLAIAFPSSKVYFHNSDTAQIEVCKRICKKYHVKNVLASTDLVPTECVLAFEAMEHVLKPIEFINPILKNKKVLFYIDGSSFTIDSIGHFPKYVHNDEVFDNKTFKRKYFKYLSDLGFHQCFATKFWHHPRFFNGRPNIFVKETFIGKREDRSK